MKNNTYTIALMGFDDIDENIFAQMIERHHPKINYVRDNGDGTDIEMILHDYDLPMLPRRAGKILDMIDYHMHQTPYQNIPPYKDYILDWKESRLTIGNKDILLTERERDVMAELIIAGETGCRRDYLLNKIWGYRADLDPHTVETHLYRLRQKIEHTPDTPKRLVTIESGYRLE
jgi:DNA-binding response OmpR family regulator